MNKTILRKSKKYIKSEAFREYSHLHLFQIVGSVTERNTKQLTCKNKKLHDFKIKFNKLSKDKYNIPLDSLESLDLSC